MRPIRSLAALFIVAASSFGVPQAYAELIPSPDGQTVYDTTLHVTWLANANLAGTAGGQFGVSNINPSGSMSYATAAQWVAALNAQNYLGHSTWMLPTTPQDDPTCSTKGPHDARFGIGCRHSALGGLYADRGSLGLAYPSPAVPAADGAVGPFTNLQPYLYWSATSLGSSGYSTFSFNSGWQGANVDNHVMYVLPMFQGPPPGSGFAACAVPASAACPLEPTPDGSLVYDPLANVTWLADADLARSMSVPCADCAIAADGAMSHASAERFIAAMNAYNGGAGWLGITTWQLPPASTDDETCSLGHDTRATFGFGCTGSPLGELYYEQLLGGLAQGTPVAGVSAGASGPFSNVQPYLYWSCQRAASGADACDGAPADNFQWSFSFGNGFEGTDVLANDLYVLVYAPDPALPPVAVPTPRVPPAPAPCRGGRPAQPPRCV